MGTELQFLFSPLATLPKPKFDALSSRSNTSDSWAYHREGLLKAILRTGLHRPEETMDEMNEQSNCETMRKMMLKQEKIFREQVQELHRLYRIQKLLMAELSSNKKLEHGSLTNSEPEDIHLNSKYIVPQARMGYFSNTTSSQSSHSPISSTYHPTVHTNFDNKFHQSFDARYNPSSNEQSSCSGYGLRIHRGFDLERVAEEENSTGIMEDLTPAYEGISKGKMIVHGSQDLRSSADGDCDVELTLGIGPRTDKMKSKNHPHSSIQSVCTQVIHDETTQLSPFISSRSNPEEESSGASATNLEQESLRNPHWLFHTRKINRM